MLVLSPFPKENHLSFREEEAVLHVTSSRYNTSIRHDPVHATRFGTVHIYQAKGTKVTRSSDRNLVTVGISFPEMWQCFLQMQGRKRPDSATSSIHASVSAEESLQHSTLLFAWNSTLTYAL